LLPPQRRTAEVEKLRTETADRYAAERRLREQLRDAHANSDAVSADAERLRATARFASLEGLARQSPFAEHVPPVETVGATSHRASYLSSPALSSGGGGAQPGFALARRQARRSGHSPSTPSRGAVAFAGAPSSTSTAGGGGQAGRLEGAPRSPRPPLASGAYGR